MFSDDYLDADIVATFCLLRTEAVQNYTPKTELAALESQIAEEYATKQDLADVVVSAGGGLTKTLADTYYAPLALQTTVSSLSTDVQSRALTTEVATAFDGVATALTGKSDINHTHTGVYQPAGSYLVAADIAGKADSAAVTTALAGKSDTTHNHDTRYADINHIHNMTSYQTKANMTGTGTTYYSSAQTDTLLGGKSDTTHDHTGVYQPVGSYLVAADIAGKADQATTYTKTECDATFATVGTSGITKTQADTYYAPITGSTEYATASHNHTGVYQPVGSYLVAADIAGKADTTDVTTALAGKSDINHTHTGVYQPVGSYLVAADIAGKADSSAVTTALAGKSDTTHDHTGVYQPVGSYLTDGSVYQTKANMVVVGAESTYYSGAKVDALIAGISTSATTYSLRLNGGATVGNWAWTQLWTWTTDTANTSKPANLTVDNTCIANLTTTDFLVWSCCRVKFPQPPATGQKEIQTTLVPASKGPYTGTPVQKQYASYANPTDHQELTYRLESAAMGVMETVNIFRMPAGSWFGLNVEEQFGGTTSVTLEWALMPL